MEELKSNFLNVVQNNYFNPNGRARRREYWLFVLAQLLIGVAITVVFTLLGFVAEFFAAIGSILSGLVSLALLLPGITLAIRRLHDVNKSGWFLLIALIPLIGAFVLLYFMVTPGDAGVNEYGEDPKA